MAITQNANVKFKRGTQAALDLLRNNEATVWDEGTFYLTTDTNRLFFAQESDSLVDLNQYIHIWESSTLPTTGLEPGDMYYLVNQNALIIYNGKGTGAGGSSNQWTQLNTDTALAAANGTMLNVGAKSGNSITISAAVADTAGTQATGNFSLVEGSNVTLSQSGNAITISSDNDNDNTTYTLTTEATPANQGNLVLTPYDGEIAGTAQNITFAGAGNVSVSSDANGTITISGSGGIGTPTQRFDSSGNLTTQIPLNDGSNTTYNLSVMPEIKYGLNGTTSAKFISSTTPAASTTGNAVLDVYTTSEVDAKISSELSGLDALKYQGTVSSSDYSTKLISTANAGDTFKATTSLTIADSLIHSENSSLNGTANAGDLIIARGTDGNVIWEVVPSGDDSATAVNLGTANDGIFSVVVGDQVNDASSGTLVLSGGTNIDISAAISGRQKTFTIAHSTPVAASGTATVADAVAANTTLNTASSIDIPVVTQLSIDSQGHIADSPVVKTYRIVDTHATLGAMTPNVSVSNNNASIGYSVVYDGVSHNTGVTHLVANGGLQLNVPQGSSDTLELSLVWGSF